MSKKVLAIDFGASSGRGMVADFDGKKMTIEEILRFNNTPVIVKDTLYWDALRLFHHIKRCLIAAKKYDIESVSIDTWGVDFALLDRDGVMQGNPVHYRDKRTVGMVDFTTKAEIDAERLYEITGIEPLEINTLFQLEALLLNHGSHIEMASELLFMPDFFIYLLSGEDRTEPSIASTSQLMDVRTKQWSREILDAIELDKPQLPGIEPSGTIVGKITPDLAKEMGIKPIDVVRGCGHDTQCAIAAVPALEEDFLYISSGTWSLFGTELDEPLINEQTRAIGLSNEIGFGGKTTLLKNIAGLWLVQECRRQWAKDGNEFTYDELEKLGHESTAFRSFIDPASADFVGVGDIPNRIREFCEFTGQPIPESYGEILRCIYESLALKYRQVKEQIEECTGKKYDKIYVVGGGVKDDTLMKCVANACNCTVACGPIEATAYGNAAIQYIAAGDIPDLKTARQIISDSIDQKIYEPRFTENWDEAYKRYSKIVCIGECDEEEE